MGSQSAKSPTMAILLTLVVNDAPLPGGAAIDVYEERLRALGQTGK